MAALRRALRRALVATLYLSGSTAHAVEPPAIAAAADLKFALAEIAAHFERESGARLRLTFGSSGSFTHQIEQGAPFELFLSADEDFVFRLADRGLTEDRGVLYAIGRIVLFAPHGSPLAVDPALEGLRAAVEAGAIRHFAIANPEHAPYGRAARAALRHAQLWEPLARRLVLGENAAQAMQFAASGSSQGGIVPLSLSLAPEIAKLGRFATIPAEWHAGEPLRQRMVLLPKAGPETRRFYAHLQEPAARAIFVRHGFVLPGEEPP